MASLDSERERIKKELFKYIDENCLFRCNPEKTYSLSLPQGTIAPQSPLGRWSTWQFYLRRLTHNPKMLTYVSALIWEQIVVSLNQKKEYPAVQLCGMETSSIPLMIGIQQFAGSHGIAINSFSIRKERKPYGLFNFIDGDPADCPVIVVDDIINSGSSVHRCLDVCKYELGLTPAMNCYSIISWGRYSNKIKFQDHEINVVSLFQQNEFSTKYDPEKYWLPKDCDLTLNKRPEYK